MRDTIRNDSPSPNNEETAGKAQEMQEGENYKIEKDCLKKSAEESEDTDDDWDV